MPANIQSFWPAKQPSTAPSKMPVNTLREATHTRAPVA
jgi:hypothetical protein